MEKIVHEKEEALSQAIKIDGKEARAHWNHRRTISWYVDETYIKVKGKWKYLYRAVDKNGETLDVILSSNRNKKEARKFFRKALKFLKEKPK